MLVHVVFVVDKVAPEQVSSPKVLEFVPPSLSFHQRPRLIFNILKPTGYVMHKQFNIQQLYILPTHCIYVFCIYLRTNSDLCHLQHKLTSFITAMKSIHCAVRTGSLNKAVCASYLKG